MHGSTRPTCVGQGWGVPSWPERRYAVPICGVLILAKLDGADLSDARLETVEGLTRAQLDRAQLNRGTKLPEGVIGAENAER
jgi:hypothetical protein